MKKMWMSLLAAVAMITGSAAGYAAETSKAEPVLLPGVPDKNWFTDYRQALARAKAEKLPVVALFTGADWCPACLQLEAEVLSKPEWKKSVDGKAVLLFLNFPDKKSSWPKELLEQNEKLKEHYKVEGFPTTLILNADGRTVGLIDGYMPGGYWPNNLSRILAALE